MGRNYVRDLEEFNLDASDDEMWDLFERLEEKNRSVRKRNQMKMRQYEGYYDDEERD